MKRKNRKVKKEMKSSFLGHPYKIDINNPNEIQHLISTYRDEIDPPPNEDTIKQWVKEGIIEATTEIYQGQEYPIYILNPTKKNIGKMKMGNHWNQTPLKSRVTVIPSVTGTILPLHLKEPDKYKHPIKKAYIDCPDMIRMTQGLRKNPPGDIEKYPLRSSLMGSIGLFDELSPEEKRVELIRVFNKIFTTPLQNLFYLVSPSRV